MTYENYWNRHSIDLDQSPTEAVSEPHQTGEDPELLTKRDFFHDFSLIN
jgi:hypothetical protein